MDKISSRLDVVEKGIEMRNLYVQFETEKIRNEILWLYKHSNNTQQIRIYFSKLLGEKRVAELSDNAIQELLLIRANFLDKQIYELSHNKIETTPLKIIVQGLKLTGR